MKPIVIIPPDLMSKDDIDILRGNDICVVVATDPAKVRFLDPIPAAQNRSKIESAAILLSRRLLNGVNSGSVFHKSDFARMYMELLIQGTPLDQNGTSEEQEQRAFDYEKRAETERLARAEAKAERDARKAALLAKPKVK